MKSIRCITALVLALYGLLPAGAVAQALQPRQLAQWWLREAGTSDSMPAVVPGRVYDALLAAERIPHPYIGTNEDSVQWVGQQTWQYWSGFWLDSLPNLATELLFEGIDTHAEVYLNGQLIGQSNNAFHPWKFSCGSLLRLGQNQVEVRIQPIQPINDSLAALSPVALPEDHRVFVRKPAFHFGWDWGPKLTAGGVTGKVYLQNATAAYISSWQHTLKALTDSLALLHFELQLSQIEPELHVRALIFEQDRLVYASPGDLNILQGKVHFEVALPDPKRWWPNGQGAASLYQVHFILLEETPYGWQERQVLKAEIGLRSLELVQEADSLGRSFYFEINGQPTFIKGANFIPSDHLAGARAWQRDSILLEQAATVGVNMLRIWGGGVYPSDQFYTLANRLGLLIWQDFMFACAMYPGDSAFLQRVTAEADFQIKRLRHHPSLALWCGNNENWEGWGNWGWQRALGYNMADSLAVLADYNRLFKQLLPQKLAQLDPQRPYTHSSPLNGWGRPEAYHRGDVHYWGVWWGLATIESYRQKVGRFVSEYGMQSMPEYRSLQEITGAHDMELSIDDARLRQHQKHPTGFETLQTYLQRDFPDLKSLPHYAYASQLLQLRAMQTAIEAHRGAMPYCMGTLFWQWNDVWPAVSWSAIDHYNRPKALYYGLRQLYAPQLALVQTDSNQVNSLLLVNDQVTELAVRLELQLWSLKSGKVLRSYNEDWLLPANQVLSAGHIPKAYLRKLRRGQSILEVRLSVGDSLLSRSLWSPLPPKQQKWCDPKIEIARLDDQTISITSRRPAKNIFLNSAYLPSDNYFDLLPGESKVIRFKSNTGANDLVNVLEGNELPWFSFFDLVK